MHTHVVCLHVPESLEGNAPNCPQRLPQGEEPERVRMRGQPGMIDQLKGHSMPLTFLRGAVLNLTTIGSFHPYPSS